MDLEIHHLERAADRPPACPAAFDKGVWLELQ
jgi:hypothetical protein